MDHPNTNSPRTTLGHLPILYPLGLLGTTAGVVWLVLWLEPLLTLPGQVLVAACLLTGLGLVLRRWDRARLLALARSPERVRAEVIVNQAAEGIVIINNRGQVLSLNPAAEQLFECRLADVLHEPITRLLADPPKPSKSRFPESVPLGSILGLAAGAREVIGKRQGGETFPLELTGNTLTLGEESISVAFVRDISKRKRAQRYLTAHYAATCILAEAPSLAEALPAILQAVCEAMTWEVGLYWDRDAAAGLLRCREVYRSPQLASVPLPDPPLTCPPGQGLVGRAWTAGRTVWIEDIQQQPDLPCRSLGLPAHLHGALAFPILREQEVLGAMAFITSGQLKQDEQLLDVMVELGKQLGQFISRKQSEERLQQTTQTLQALVQAAPVAIHVLDPEGKVQLWNPAAERIFGWSREDVLGHPLPLLPVGPNGEAVAPGQSLHCQPICCCRKDGTTVEVSLSKAPLRDPAGALIGSMGILMDLTEQKKLEDQLRQAQKMEAIGQLAGGVAHDFNNLLTIITGYSDILLARLRPGAKEMDLVNQIKHAGDRAASLTRQLLAFGRKQLFQVRILDLAEVIQNLGKMLRRLIGEDIELIIRNDPHLGLIKADPGQIEQVLMNLATNARDAMPAGGTLTISTSNVELTRNGVGQLPDIRPGPYVLLEVRDTGCGMNEATLARIFEPFFTTKDVGKGTGLGLATVYGIVKQSQGHIDVESQPGLGTTFRIWLPRQEETHLNLATSRESALVLPAGKETVLLVEDEDAVRKLLGQVLQFRGYQVLEARTGEEALQLCRQHQGKIALLVTDVIMPGMNGRQLVEQVSAAQPDLKVLYMSGYPRTVLDDRAITAPGTAFLPKPINQGDLARKVRELLDAPQSLVISP